MAHKIMKHSNNNNNMARAATNPRERLCDTRRKQKAHKSMQHIMGNVNSMSGGKSGKLGEGEGLEWGSQPRRDKINYSTWKCNYENI